MKRLFLGLSGYQYYDWKGKFYPRDLPKSKWLPFYARHFSTLEVNGSFYTAIRKSTYQKWYQETPSDFSFVVKGHRYITQLKKLHEVDDAVKMFWESVSGLQEKLSCVLWQFPASFRFVDDQEKQYERLRHFLTLQPQTIRHAFEFRHESWFQEEIATLLKKYNASFVISESSVFPQKEIITSDFVYIRFHGPQKLYMSSYSEEELRQWAEKIKVYKKTCDTYVYFNNDGSGFALENARFLASLLL